MEIILWAWQSEEEAEGTEVKQRNSMKAVDV